MADDNTSVEILSFSLKCLILALLKEGILE